ncbi:MAG: adenosine deaminase [Corynebacteriales bacterium]|nr:adenosine deaminase [Mycobacteriales bacterium]
MTIAPDVLKRAPKVVLHDHLDGGLRPETLVELASEASFKKKNPKFALPSYDAKTLAEIIQRGANSGSLVEYLKPFEYTVAVMQNAEAITRIAAECVEDLAADGVVYAESRFAPGLSTEHGLSESQVVEAVLAGFELGMKNARVAGNDIEARALVCTLRHWEPTRSVDAAKVAIDFHNSGVVGFDIAGPEKGFPASDHVQAFMLLRDNNVPFTIHAGEADGVASIVDALSLGARRLGHGVRIVEDINDDGQFGATATRVRDERIALETCPCSNVQTGAVAHMAEHPLRRLQELGFAATINTDNRLMSGTSMTNEFTVGVEQLGLDLENLEQLTITAMKSAFCDETVKKERLEKIVAGYRALS